jgi:hypothetical protein
MMEPSTGAVPNKLVLSIAEAAEVPGVSDELIYELTARGASCRASGSGGGGHPDRRHPGGR